MIPMTFQIIGDRGPKSQATACDIDPATNVLFYTQVGKMYLIQFCFIRDQGVYFPYISLYFDLLLRNKLLFVVSSVRL